MVAAARWIAVAEGIVAATAAVARLGPTATLRRRIAISRASVGLAKGRVAAFQRIQAAARTGPSRGHTTAL